MNKITCQYTREAWNCYHAGVFQITLTCMLYHIFISNVLLWWYKSFAVCDIQKHCAEQVRVSVLENLIMIGFHFVKPGPGVLKSYRSRTTFQWEYSGIFWNIMEYSKILQDIMEYSRSLLFYFILEYSRISQNVTTFPKVFKNIWEYLGIF